MDTGRDTALRKILVTGGCRSGKSRHAQALAEAVPGGRRCYIATCVPLDAEMRERVARHQADRGPGWRTVEAPLDVVAAIEANGPQCDVVLVDCLTLWISNLMGAGKEMDAVVAAAQELAACVRRSIAPLILVTNEVGAGIVPENALARAYRDTAGLVNQIVAEACERVIWTMAGIPVQIKPWTGGGA
ncbi:MAG: bifunctional adenosylcobinamide kinase/adenosylcobinamide-phosphate guanylyltransferase [Desulfosarcinaceae bacterium]|nr:bifunctional adenosylcobinamide kinase/adenosylcobinamide-phosphate guanylyltransferase [Desulfosarcinaceae bacterium]